MEINNASHIIHDYFQKLSKHITRIKKRYDEEDIHAFRINVKKLSAFLSMLQSGVTSKKDLLKLPHRIKKIYSLIGKIRDRQLCIEKIKEYNTANLKLFQNPIAELKKEIKQIEGKRKSFLKRKELSEIEHEITHVIPRKAGNRLIQTFLAEKLSTILAVIAKEQYADEELHIIRKNMKGMLYIKYLYKNANKIPLPFSFWDQNQWKKVEDISNILGMFIDRGVALNLLETTAGNKPDAWEKELKALWFKWLKEKKDLKKEALGQLGTLLPLQLSKIHGYQTIE